MAKTVGDFVGAPRQVLAGAAAAALLAVARARR
jgi:hypothetical protein